MHNSLLHPFPQPSTSSAHPPPAPLATCCLSLPQKVVATPDTSATAGKFDFSGFKDGQLWVALITFLYGACRGATCEGPPLRSERKAAGSREEGQRGTHGCRRSRVCCRPGLPLTLAPAIFHCSAVDFLDATGTFYAMANYLSQFIPGFVDQKASGQPAGQGHMTGLACRRPPRVLPCFPPNPANAS